VSAMPGGVDERRHEALYPPVHGHMIDAYSPLGQRLLDIPVGQPLAQISAHRYRDQLPRNR
jgi:hypothetical protein